MIMCITFSTDIHKCWLYDWQDNDSQRNPTWVRQILPWHDIFPFNCLSVFVIRWGMRQRRWKWPTRGHGWRSTASSSIRMRSTAIRKLGHGGQQTGTRRRWKDAVSAIVVVVVAGGSPCCLSLPGGCCCCCCCYFCYCFFLFVCFVVVPVVVLLPHHHFLHPFLTFTVESHLTTKKPTIIWTRLSGARVFARVPSTVGRPASVTTTTTPQPLLRCGQWNLKMLFLEDICRTWFFFPACICHFADSWCGYLNV